MTSITIPDWFLIVWAIYFGVAKYQKIFNGFELVKQDWNRSFKWFKRNK